MHSPLLSRSDLLWAAGLAGQGRARPPHTPNPRGPYESAFLSPGYF